MIRHVYNETAEKQLSEPSETTWNYHIINESMTKLTSPRLSSLSTARLWQLGIYSDGFDKDLVFSVTTELVKLHSGHITEDGPFFGHRQRSQCKLITLGFFWSITVAELHGQWCICCWRHLKLHRWIRHYRKQATKGRLCQITFSR